MTTLEDRPRVEIVEELPSLEDERERAFVSGALVSGLFCAVVGFTLGFILGSKETQQ